MSGADLPARVRVVVIGGGAVGTSVAYHLADLGVDDVLLLEQGQLSCGTTWHAVGLVGQLRSTRALTGMIRYGTDLYSRLQDDTGLATGWKQVGSLMVARTEGRMESLRRMASLAVSFGIDAEVVDPRFVSRSWPTARADDLVGAVWLPGDGMVNPTDLTQSLARGARQRGARIVEEVRVEAIDVRDGVVRTVRTSRGDVECEVVVNCAGQWAREVGRMAGVSVPLYPVEHMYVVSEAIEGVERDIPVLRDPDGRIYVREEIGGLIVGGFEPDAKPWLETVPPDFCFQLLDEDWDQFAVLMESAVHRVPALESSGIKKFYNGPESFTPDNQFILGEAPEVRGFYVAAGFNSVGIASAGGAGLALARWIVEGTEPFDLWAVDPRRFAPCHANANWLRARVSEAVGRMYDIPWPGHEFHEGRMLRRSPAHDVLARQGAHFAEVAGWECPDWFDPGDLPPVDPSFGPQAWFPASAAEFAACRDAVGVWDASTIGKLAVSGPGAAEAIGRLGTAEVGASPGMVARSLLLNDGGRCEADVLVAAWGAGLVVLTGTERARRDGAYLSRRLSARSDGVRVDDVTAAWGAVAGIGPRSAEVLSVLAGTVVADRLAGARPADGRAWCAPVELGWADGLAVFANLYGLPAWLCLVPVDQAARAYEQACAAAGGIGGRPIGRRALEALRLEASRPQWGADVSARDTPLEIGSPVVDTLRGGRSFTGREALVAQLSEGVRRRLVAVVLAEPEPVIWGDEPLLRDGVLVGRVTSAAYGFGRGRGVGLALAERESGSLDPEWLAGGTFEVEVGGRRSAVAVELVGGYDPGPLATPRAGHRAHRSATMEEAIVRSSPWQS